MEAYQTKFHDRHITILQLAAEGHTVKKIAEQLNIRAHAVSDYMEYIRMTLEASNTTHAIYIAMKKGIIN